MNALHLYEISNQLRALEQLGESDDLPAEVIHDTLEALEGDFEAKAVQVAKFIMALEANADAVTEAAKAMARRADRIANRAASIRSYLQFHMQGLQKKRIESPDLVIARRENPPAVIVTEHAVIPEKYFVQPPPLAPRLDKKALKAAIDAGEQIDGVYVERSERLEIKI